MDGEGSGGYGGRKSKKQKEAEIVKKNNGGHGVLTSIFLKIDRTSDKALHEFLDESDRLSTQTYVRTTQIFARCG
jgi:hypothetical protein